MNLKSLSDQQLLTQTKQLAQQERQKLTEILHHLREVERRKLYSDLKYKSLFDYCINELRYSEGQAGRRINAMRIMCELPEIESKIESGKLSLTNIYKAKSYFTEIKKIEPRKNLDSEQKLGFLEKLEGKSARQAEQIILASLPRSPIPDEVERLLTPELTELRFVVSEEVKVKMSEIKDLIGPRAALMNLSELFNYMTDSTLEMLTRNKKVKGQKPFEKSDNVTTVSINPTTETDIRQTYVSPLQPIAKSSIEAMTPTPPGEPHRPITSRYIPQRVRDEIWNRDKARCTQCGSRRNLNIDHIQPFARGGTSTLENLRLLCFNCNQRQAIKSFGVEQIRNRPNLNQKSSLDSKSHLGRNFS